MERKATPVNEKEAEKLWKKFATDCTGKFGNYGVSWLDEYNLNFSTDSEDDTFDLYNKEVLEDLEKFRNMPDSVYSPQARQQTQDMFADAIYVQQHNIFKDYSNFVFLPIYQGETAAEFTCKYCNFIQHIADLCNAEDGYGSVTWWSDKNVMYETRDLQGKAIILVADKLKGRKTLEKWIGKVKIELCAHPIGFYFLAKRCGKISDSKNEKS